jgi:hypothetical protein
MSGQSVAYSDLLEIAKRNVDFKKLWSACWSFFLPALNKRSSASIGGNLHRDYRWYVGLLAALRRA